MSEEGQPRFRTEGKPPHVTVYLQCSKCAKDIRPMLMTEKISVTRGYYCKECDDGVVHLNPPQPPSKDESHE